MKKLIILLLTLTLIAVSLVSCSGPEFTRAYPHSSENFSYSFIKSFGENYIIDPQLHYYSAYPPEVQFSYGRFLNSDLRLALIKDTDSKDFVAGINVQFSDHIYLQGPDQSSPYRSRAFAIRSKDAPNPMSDWTISSIRLVSLSATEVTSDNFIYNLLDRKGLDSTQLTDFAYNESLDDFERYAQSPFSSSAVELVRLTDTDKIQKIKDSYVASIEVYSEPYYNDKSVAKITFYNEFGVYMERNVKSEKETNVTKYYVVVEFEENKNIFWCSPLLEFEDCIYMYNASKNWPKSTNFYFCKLDEEIAQQLRPYLPEPIKEEGAPENTSSSSTTATTTSTGQNTTSATTASTTK